MHLQAVNNQIMMFKRSPTIVNKQRKQNTKTNGNPRKLSMSPSFTQHYPLPSPPQKHPLQHPHWPCLTPQSMITHSYLHTNINIVTAIPWKQRPPKWCHVVNIVYKLNCIGYTWLLATPPRIFPISQSQVTWIEKLQTARPAVFVSASGCCWVKKGELISIYRYCIYITTGIIGVYF